MHPLPLGVGFRPVSCYVTARAAKPTTTNFSIYVTFGSLSQNTRKNTPPLFAVRPAMVAEGNPTFRKNAKRLDRGAGALLKRVVSRSGPVRPQDNDQPMADVEASGPGAGLPGLLHGMRLPEDVVSEVTKRVTEELQARLMSSMEGRSIEEQRDLIGLTRDGTRERDKALRAKFAAPEKETWSPEHSHKYCEQVGQHLLAYGMSLTSQESANYGFKCLPDSVQIHITPVDVEKDPLFGAATAFSSWVEIVATIKEKYGARAQKAILAKLQQLRMECGKARQFKETFYELKKELEDGYCPSANDLLTIVQGAMYAELASQEAVKWSPSITGLPTAWKPAQYAELIDVCVNVDDLLAESAKTGKSKFTVVLLNNVDDSAGADTGVNKPANKSKRRKRKGAPGEAATGAGGGSAGANDGTAKHASGTAQGQDRKEKFKKIRFADPKVQEAAEKGHCLTCLKPGHFARQCKIQPPKKHERLP